MEKNIILFTYNNSADFKRVYKLLNNIDVLITGRYIERLRDITDNNRWRGSRNQRVLDLQKSLFEGKQVMKTGIPNNDEEG